MLRTRTEYIFKFKIKVLFSKNIEIFCGKEHGGTQKKESIILFSRLEYN